MIGISARTWKTTLTIILATLLVLAAVAACARSSPSATPAPTATPQPTATSQPTASSQPSATPQPTATATSVPMTDDVWSRIQATGTIVVGISADYPPFAYYYSRT